MRRIQFANDFLYHAYNRGTDKRKIFLDEKDYFRFIHDLYEFNNNSASFNVGFRFTKSKNYGGPPAIIGSAPAIITRDRLVDILLFCLMPNHFHLLLKELKNNGIAKFMQKLGTGYTMYFNQRYKRSGVLFQGKFKGILIDKDEYLLPLSAYIHSNPVELLELSWKEKGIKDFQKTKEFLNNYRWSSYLDCIGIKNFPSVIYNDILMSYFKNERGYEQYLTDYLSKDSNEIGNIILD